MRYTGDDEPRLYFSDRFLLRRLADVMHELAWALAVRQAFDDDIQNYLVPCASCGCILTDRGCANCTPVIR